MCNDDLRSVYLVPPIGRLLHKLSTRMIKFNCHYYFIIFFLRLLLYRTHAHATLNFYRFNFGLERTYSEEVTNVQKKKNQKLAGPNDRQANIVTLQIIIIVVIYILLST